VQKYRGALNELAKQKSAGKDTSAADIAKALQVAEYRGRELDKVSQQREAERRNRMEEFSKTPQGKIDFDGKASAAFQAQLNKELETKYAPKAQAVHDAADQMLGLTKAGGVLKSAPSSAPKAPPKIGTTIQVDGKLFKVTGFNPKTNKPVGSFVGN
jgi:hypothetical protein